MNLSSLKEDGEIETESLECTINRLIYQRQKASTKNFHSMKFNEYFYSELNPCENSQFSNRISSINTLLKLDDFLSHSVSDEKKVFFLREYLST